MVLQAHMAPATATHVAHVLSWAIRIGAPASAVLVADLLALVVADERILFAIGRALTRWRLEAPDH